MLAGNHDVGHAAADYSRYSKYFGADRYAANPWYGGQIQDNRGHYDLITVDGIDFLMLYMGWAPGDEQIAWMNKVIKRYPERKVWIGLHEYLLTTGTLGPIPQRIYDEVITPNPNVIAVSSGHYHDAYTRTDDFDDDGDGETDRTVYSMLFDYQGLPEGGLGYLRLLHFDNEGGRMIVRTYSPSLGDFDSDDASLNTPAGQQEFEIPYASIGIDPTTKTLATDAFRADVLTTEDIATFTGVASGSTVDALWRDVPPGEHGWYVQTEGPHGGVASSEVHTFTALAAGELTTATPVIAGIAQVGNTLAVNPGTWGSDGVDLDYQWYADGAPLAGETDTELELGTTLVGSRISARVTGTLDGYAAATEESAATEPVAAGDLTTATPLIVGKASLGRTLSVQPGSWGPEGVALRYRWYADGKPISGATGTRLRLGVSLVGRAITVRVTGTLDGYATARVTSAPTERVAPGELRGKRPRIVGAPVVGKRLAAITGRWRPAPVTLTYRWFAGSRAISGAHGRTLRVTQRQLGTRITVQVVASKPGFRTERSTSVPTRPVRPGGRG